MSARFIRLRIAGFKSFAEAASLEILPGLTGIVGPNGCGKSNVVEALRWAMGENSARSLRGGEMDDLIFAGTAARPARQFAEVTLTLDGAAGLTPPPQDRPELEITRRIERGAGSSYRINGREARARDVQTLFADLASGARSSALVSQGRVAAIIAARPEERRSILEEAAGITGLHARRHEAELKLHAAEANLARADDLRLQLQARLTELEAQSGQASHYRAVAAALRDAETALLALLHARARLAAGQARAAAAAAASTLDDAERRARAAEAAEQWAQSSLAAPRDAEAAARSVLDRLGLAGATLAQEDGRIEAEAAAAELRARQGDEDAAAAAGRLGDAEATLARLEADHVAAASRQAAMPVLLRQAGEALREAEAGLADAGDALSRATAQEAADRDRAAQHARDREAAVRQLRRLDSQLDPVRAEHQAALRERPDEDALCRLQQAGEAAAVGLDAARRTAEQAGEARLQLALQADAARAAAVEARRIGEAARRLVSQTTQRLDRLAAELRTVEAGAVQAERGLIPQDARSRAAERIARCQTGLDTARQALEAAEGCRAAAQQTHAAAGQQLAEAERRQRQAEAARQAAASAASRASGQYDQLVGDAAAAEAALVPADTLLAARRSLGAASQELAEARQALTGAETTLGEAEREAAAQGRMLASARAEQARIEAEADGLSRAITAEAVTAGGERWPTLAETLPVPAGLELALAAVLGEGLDAALDEAAPRHWRDLPALPDPALPAGAVALSSLVEIPDPLRRILGQAGLVEDAADGSALQPELAPGQCLVARSGALWRWDGLRLASGAATGGAVRRAASALELRRRLRQARSRLEPAAAETATLQRRAEAAAGALAASAIRAQRARARQDAAEHALAGLRDAFSTLDARAAASRARLDAINPQRDRAAEGRALALRAVAEADAADRDLPDLATLAQCLEHGRSHEAAALQVEAAARRARQRAEAELEAARRDEAELLSRHVEAQARLEAMRPQRARLEQELGVARAEARVAGAALEETAPAEQAAGFLRDAVARADAAASHEAAARLARDEAERQRDEARSAHAEAASRLDRQRSRIDALSPRLDALAEERREAAGLLDRLLAEAAAIADPADAAAASARAQAAFAVARTHEADRRDARARCAAEAETLEADRNRLAAARDDWTRREAAARRDHAAAVARAAVDASARDALAARIAQFEQRRRAHGLALAQAGQAQAQAEAALHAQVQGLAEAQAARRQADIAVSQAREATLRQQGRVEQADAILAGLLAETPDPPAQRPDDLSDAAETGLRRRIAEFVRTREEIGPVNLRADIESAEVRAGAEAIAGERTELEAAIALLHGSIGQANRDGRSRLLEVLDAVDRQFQALFARLFGGGRAQLGMVGNDDPLLAGLEIYAQPPGKKLATLSLLSGGEQALTALCLIFAVFRCNPAPVCVLDEVDAPLDDANVGRFCALLADMVAQADTRFLVVTHHQLTMAHMDRLYGVTMQERGVSRLLSVDLAAASDPASLRRRQA